MKWHVEVKHQQLMSTYIFELAISVNGILKMNDEGNKLLQLAKKCPKIAPKAFFYF